MNQETVKASLVKHIEVVEKSLLWAMAIAVVVGWAGIRGAGPIDIAGIKTNRSDAHIVAALAFVFANLGILAALLRIGDLLVLLDNVEFENGIEGVMTHQSLFNPFAYFGDGWVSRLYSCTGYGLLIICWWICFTAISTLRGFSPTPDAVEGCLLVVGGLSLLAVHRAQASLQGRLHRIDSRYSQAVIRVNNVRSKVASLSGVTGVVIFALVKHYMGK
jgi:hypothetical protein